MVTLSKRDVWMLVALLALNAVYVAWSTNRLMELERGCGELESEAE